MFITRHAKTKPDSQIFSLHRVLRGTVFLIGLIFWFYALHVFYKDLITDSSQLSSLTKCNSSGFRVSLWTINDPLFPTLTWSQLFLQRYRTMVMQRYVCSTFLQRREFLLKRFLRESDSAPRDLGVKLTLHFWPSSLRQYKSSFSCTTALQSHTPPSVYTDLQ